MPEQKIQIEELLQKEMQEVEGKQFMKLFLWFLTCIGLQALFYIGFKYLALFYTEISRYNFIIAPLLICCAVIIANYIFYPNDNFKKVDIINFLEKLDNKHQSK